MSSPENLYSILDRIEQRPGLYLSSATLSALDDYLSGYEQARWTLRMDDSETPSFSRFSDFCLQKLGKAGSWVEVAIDPDTDMKHVKHFPGPTWHSTLREAEPDDEKAFLLFFSLLRAYRAKA